MRRVEYFAKVARIYKKVCEFMGIYSATTSFMPAMKHVLGLRGRGMTDVVRPAAVRVCESEAAPAKEYTDVAEGECRV